MKIHISERGLALAAAIGFAAAATAQQPAGDPGSTANDPASNQAANPADTGDTGATRSRVPVSEPYLPLTVDHFNYLDEDQDGALSEAELAEDATLEDRFEEMDADRNREIDHGEFRGYQPTRPVDESPEDLTGARETDSETLIS